MARSRAPKPSRRHKEAGSAAPARAPAPAREAAPQGREPTSPNQQIEQEIRGAPAEPPAAPAEGRVDALALVCFALSGFAGLVYEIAWIRRASLVFGSTTLAVSTVLAVFFLGLAGGSYAAGRHAERSARPLRVYAALELGLGLFACLTPLAFDAVDAAYGAVYRALGPGGAASLAARGALVALVLLPATLAMGATLPLFCRRYVRATSTLGRGVGLLYGVNTLGAAAGCLATGLALLPWLGIAGSIYVAAAINVAIGVAIGTSALGRAELPADPPRPDAIDAPRRALAIDALAFVSGFVALGAEVLWTRYLSLLLRNTVYTYTWTLAAVLLGIVAGSLAAAALVDRAAARAQALGATLALWAVFTLALMKAPTPAFREGGSAELGAFFLLVPPAVLSGAAFPLLVRLATTDAARAPSAAGRVTALNVAGGVLGSLVVGFAGLPRAGLEASLLTLTALALAAGIGAWLALDGASAKGGRALAIGAVILGWLAVPRIATTRLPEDLLADRASLVDFHEGYGSTLAVVRRAPGIELQIDRYWQGEDRKNHQAMAAHVPMLLHPGARRALVVGAGTGQTASRFLMYGVERLDCVDIEPTLFDFVARHFDPAWMHDPRARLLPEDGRTHLLHATARYDVISLEVGQVFRPGTSSFYTEELYRRARERLEDGGLLTQFVPLAFFGPDELRGVVRTFLEVFPESVLWYNRAELLLLGVKGDRAALGREVARRLAARGAVRDDLRFSLWGGAQHTLDRPEVFFAGLLAGPRGLAGLASRGAVYRDDRPVLDYATASASEQETRELPLLEVLSPRLEALGDVLPGAAEGLDLARIDALRAKNLGEIAATALLRTAMPAVLARRYAEAIPRLEEAQRQNDDDFEVRRVLAGTLVAAGRHAEALRHHEHAATLRPDDADAHAGLAECLHQMGRVDGAIRAYLEALRLRPGDARLHNLLGWRSGRAGSSRRQRPSSRRRCGSSRI
jgi:spermidine synthase